MKISVPFLRPCFFFISLKVISSTIIACFQLGGFALSDRAIILFGRSRGFCDDCPFIDEDADSWGQLHLRN